MRHIKKKGGFLNIESGEIERDSCISVMMKEWGKLLEAISNNYYYYLND